MISNVANPTDQSTMNMKLIDVILNKIIKEKTKYNNSALTKQPTDNVIFKRFRLLKKLQDIFGSMATKLDHIESDLDISIYLPVNNVLSLDNYFTINNLVEVKQHRTQRILEPIKLKYLKQEIDIILK